MNQPKTPVSQPDGMADTRVALLSREYPPEVYGGAGVHVEYLARELGHLVKVDVHCFGQPRPAPEVRRAYPAWSEIAGNEPHLAALRTLSVDLVMAAGLNEASLAHSHTWYANFAGHLAKLIYGIPHVMTSHSLEPLRPWKAEQLGGGYAVSCFCERTAIEAADAAIAVSQGMKRDILNCYPAVSQSRVHVIYNGVDTDEYRPVTERYVLTREGISTERPMVVFVGRITRQKGIVHLLRAARFFSEDVQLVLCAGEPDTPELGREVADLVSQLMAERSGVFWIDRMLPRDEIRQLLSAATAFICPSVYEPFGIVNVEAMACGAAVVASAVGGIPEVVVDGRTGYLVPFDADADPNGGPKDPDGFCRALADRVNALASSPEQAQAMGRAGRKRAVSTFSWRTIAGQTANLYADLLAKQSR